MRAIFWYGLDNMIVEDKSLDEDHCWGQTCILSFPYTGKELHYRLYRQEQYGTSPARYL